MIRVPIADDHPIVRKGLAYILASAEGIEVAAEAGSAEEVTSILARGLQPDVLVLDIGMPGRSGIEILPELKKEYPALPVLILSQYPAEQIAVRAIRSGASGYLNKESAPAQLVDAVRRLMEGRKFITERIAELLAETVGGKAGNPHEALSGREYDVLVLIASGKTVSQIGEQLHLSVKTISTYRTRILDKMGLRSNAELMVYAVRNGLVDGM